MSLFVGGCSAFGHSCFGGHGKRADDGVLLIPGQNSDQQSRVVFPPTAAAAGSEGSDDAVMQTGSFGALSASPSEPWFPSAHNLSPFLRQWVRFLPSSTETAFPRLVYLTNAPLIIIIRVWPRSLTILIYVALGQPRREHETKLAIGSARDASQQKHGSEVGCPPSIRLRDFSKNNDASATVIGQPVRPICRLVVSCYGAI